MSRLPGAGQVFPGREFYGTLNSGSSRTAYNGHVKKPKSSPSGLGPKEKIHMARFTMVGSQSRHLFTLCLNFARVIAGLCPRISRGCSNSLTSISFHQG